MRTTFPLRTLALASSLAVGLSLAVPASGTTPDASPGRGSPAQTYQNAVSDTFADTFADPAVIRGKDGYWYAYGTTDPLREGEGTRHLLPVSRSTDLVTWEYVGDAFTEDTLPAWADTTRGAALWAPDIRYVDGEYRLYYVVTETTVTDEPNDNAIGVATAPTPTGPWTDSGGPVVGPRPGAGGAGDYLWTFDPSHVVDPDGTEHLFFGSYYGGIYVTELSADGTRAVGDPTRVAVDNKYEGAYVVQRDGWWYLFASSANCCAGPTTGYSVHVGRSRDLAGPYVDREGVPLDQSRAGGTPVLAPNGNEWVGTGHNAVVTDLAGQDWIVYHAIDRADPYLDGTDGINERPMLIDRLDWIDGWPTTRGGAWASDGREKAPVASGRTVTDFSDGIPRTWRTDGRWALADDDAGDAGQHAVGTVRRGQDATLTTSAPSSRRGVRVEGDLRSDGGVYGLVVGDAGAKSRTGKTTNGKAHGPRGTSLRAVVDDGALRLELVRRGRSSTLATSALPDDFDATAWHAVALTVRGSEVTAEVSHARLGDPVALTTAELPRRTVLTGRAGAVVAEGAADVDNLSVLAAARPSTKVVPTPRPGRLVSSDEFRGDALGSGWTVLRNPAVTVADGALRWPTEAADLSGSGNDAGVLLRDVPRGDWVAETKLTIDLGTDEIRNYQQGGLIAYVDDDRFARLSHVAIWNTRQTEFGTEMPYAGRLAYGGTIVGPPAETTWLRLVHRTDRRGEREVQAFTSTDGRTWIAGGVWTFPQGSDVKVGLISHGGAGATSEFDYLRISRLAR